MAMFTDVMTVYNYFIDENGKACWKRTVVKGVQWRHNKRNVNLSGKVQNETAVESITIDFKHNYGNKEYLESKVFVKSAEKGKFWTLNTEDALDIVILGEIRQDIAGDYKFNNLKEEYDCRTVVSVTDNRNRDFLKNIKVVAK